MLITFRAAVAAAAVATVLKASAGCGSAATTAVPVGATDAASATTSATRPAAGATSTKPTATRGTVSTRPTRKPDTPATSAGTTRPASGTGPRILSVGLTTPDPRDGTGMPVDAFHQKGCGTPDSVNIHVQVTDPTGRMNRMYYEYEVSAKEPLRGRSDFFEIGTIRNGVENYKTVIGPIEAHDANAAGGTVTITIHAVNTAGKEAPTRQLRAKLLPCD